ncbi:MAG: hypothetical protein GXP42_04100 [Chloroflexi bacterium]|nr:hypothetical protein [Chloroflexota bacterium]
MSNLKMESPGRYQICVQGYLSADWSDRLGGLHIVTRETDEGEFVTTLTGEVVDQAVLLGILNTLYDLRYPLLSLRFFGTAAADDDALIMEKDDQALR